MPGETSLELLLKSVEPRINEGQFVYCTFEVLPSQELADKAVVTIKEAEGLTLVLPKAVADAVQPPIHYEYVAGWITLQVHSALSAVGLTAAIAKALAQHEISCNVVAGYYHDHLFVDYKDTQRALAAIRKLGQSINCNH